MHFLASALEINLKKNFLYFFLKKSDLKKFLLFSQKSFSNFQKNELSYIQYPSTVRTRSIFRTLLNIYDGTFCKNSCLTNFSAQARNFYLKIPYIFPKKAP